MKSLPATRSPVAPIASTKYDLIKSISPPPRTEQVMAPTPLAPSPRTPTRAITCEAASKPPTSSPVETTLTRRGIQNDFATRRFNVAIVAIVATHRNPRCCSGSITTRCQPLPRTATPPASRRSRAKPLSVVGPPRAAEPRAWLGPVARSEASTTGRSSTSHAGGQPEEKTCRDCRPRARVLERFRDGN